MKYNTLSKIILIALTATNIEAKTGIDLPSFIYDGKRADARAVGMGEAFVSVCDNPSAAYWNPAGIKQLQRNYFFTCLDIFDKTDADGAYLHKNDSLGNKQMLLLGLAAKEGAFTFRPVTHYSGVYNNREIDIRVNKYTLSSASEYSQNMLIGINLSYISGNMGVVDRNNLSARVSNGDGAAVDWGLLYSMNEYVKLGFDIENAPGYIWWDEYGHHQLKSHLQTGFSIKYSEWLLVAMEYENKNVDLKWKDYYHIGLQQGIYRAVFLRQGVIFKDISKIKSDKNTYTFGLGCAIKNDFTIDVSAKTEKLDNPANDKVTNYLFSVNMPF